jgi:hypothetical protein
VGRNFLSSHKQPPKGQPFKPGESGNPAGRPKGIRGLIDEFFGEGARILIGKLAKIAKSERTPSRLVVDISKMILPLRHGLPAPATSESEPPVFQRLVFGGRYLPDGSLKATDGTGRAFEVLGPDDAPIVIQHDDDDDDGPLEAIVDVTGQLPALVIDRVRPEDIQHSREAQDDGRDLGRARPKPPAAVVESTPVQQVSPPKPAAPQTPPQTPAPSRVPIDPDVLELASSYASDAHARGFTEAQPSEFIAAAEARLGRRKARPFAERAKEQEEAEAERRAWERFL